MRALNPAVMAVIGTQHGVIGSAQLDELGVTEHQRRGLVRDGILGHVIDGAYRLTSTTETDLVRCAAVTVSRPSLVVAGPTAARLIGFRRTPHDDRVHLIGPPASQPLPKHRYRVYRTAAIDPTDIVTNDAVRLTSAARTVIDMVRHTSDDAVASMIEQGFDRRWFDHGMLVRTLEPLLTPGRPWARRFERILGRRLAGGHAQSDWEHRVGQALAAAGITGLVRQHRLDTHTIGPIHLDLAIPHLQWGLEIDVHPDHLGAAGTSRDKRRDRAAASLGWQVSRVAEDDLRHRFDRTVSELIALVRSRAMSHVRSSDAHRSSDRRSLAER